jgi:hypothetical protein
MDGESSVTEVAIEKLGFEKRADFQYGEGSRWIEVAPAGSTIAIALVPPSEGKSARGDKTHCAISTKDIEADHATLRAKGVDVDAEIARKGTRRSGLISVEVTIADPSLAVTGRFHPSQRSIRRVR